MKKSELVDVLQQISQLVSRVANASEASDAPQVYGNKASGIQNDFRPKLDGNAFAAAPADPAVHKIGNHVLCDTEGRGFATPQNRSPAELVLDASEGFIPLWAKGVVLRWRFNEASLGFFQNVNSAKAGIRNLLTNAIAMWGDAAPVGFNELNDAWDFEIVMRPSDNCNASGCVLASAFFPDAGRHQLVLYPQMFEQSEQEQRETLAHEIGHIFGLRHFFAQVSEQAWPSIIFGKHTKFSIMNYGADSVLTDDDRSDLKKLYQAVWSGQLTEINGTPIRLFKPFHDSGAVVWPSAIAAKNTVDC